MQITQDKFQESTYHFNRLKNMLNDILNEHDFNILIYQVIEFRYELNACVNSFRATTFALQKEHRKKDGVKFEIWYEGAKKKLVSDEFSKIIQELRNINQKEGNIYPTFEFVGESDKAIIYFEIDYTHKESDFIIKKKIIPKVEILVNISNINPGETMDKFTIEDQNLINIAAANFFAEQQMIIIEKNQFKLEKLIIDRFSKEYTPNEFLDNLIRMGNILKEIVADGWKVLV